MNIIFLDIDGVLNSKLWYDSKLCKSFGTSVKRYFDPNCIQLLNDLIDKSSAKIVISSSWRILRTLQELQDIFISVGFEGTIIGRTPISYSYDINNSISRGLEIQEWLNDFKIKIQVSIKYAIIDDEDGFLENQKIYFFQTSPITGLDGSLKEKVINFFKE